MSETKYGMQNMKLLETYKRILMMLGACPLDEDASKWKKVAFSIFAFAVFTSQCFAATSSAFFILRFISVNRGDTFYALLQVFGLTFVIYELIVAFILRHKFNRIFVKLSEIYDECKH